MRTPRRGPPRLARVQAAAEETHPSGRAIGTQRWGSRFTRHTRQPPTPANFSGQLPGRFRQLQALHGIRADAQTATEERGSSRKQGGVQMPVLREKKRSGRRHRRPQGAPAPSSASKAGESSAGFVKRRNGSTRTHKSQSLCGFWGGSKEERRNTGHTACCRSSCTRLALDLA